MTLSHKKQQVTFTDIVKRNLPGIGHIKFERVWAMPDKRTFQIPPIKKLIKEEFQDGNYLDPFPFEAKIDCFDFFKSITLLHKYAVLDPPYTNRQVSEHYKKNGGKVTGWHTSSGWVAKVKDELAKLILPGGKVISFGYNTCGLGKTRGFEITRILDVCHGGSHYDTLCTVERKNQEILN